MITVILENGESSELSRVALPGNERYLIRDVATSPLLSQLSEFSYDVFSHAEMDCLISELETLSKELDATEKAHIADIIELACRCRDDRTLTLTFTPVD